MIASRSARPWLATGAILVVCSLASTAPAEPQGPAAPRAGALAQVLFEEGVSLMGEGHFEEACPKLAESQRLDPGGGTLLNLASCLEGLGQLASAYSTYSDALSVAIRDGRKEREAVARERLAVLQPRMSRLELRVAEPSLQAEIVLDGTRIGATAWHTPLPIDPGAHTLSASAPGRVTWSRTFDVPANGARLELEVPALAAATIATETASEAPVVTPKGVALAPNVLPEPTPLRRTVATTSLVGGGILVGLGAVAGVFALSKKAESDDACPTPTSCGAGGVSAMRTAETFAWTSNVAIGVGLVAAAAGVILLLTEPRSRRAGLVTVPIMGSF